MWDMLRAKPGKEGSRFSYLVRDPDHDCAWGESQCSRPQVGGIIGGAGASAGADIPLGAVYLDHEFGSPLAFAEEQAAAESLGEGQCAGQSQSMAPNGEPVHFNTLKILVKNLVVVCFGDAGTVIPD